MENEIIRIVNLRGSEAINELRDKARAIAQALNAEREMQELDDLVGAVLGSRNTALETSAALAHRDGISFDKDRIELFAALQSELLRDEFHERSAPPGPTQVLSFFEAYFSNWIEGTEFELDEAEEIVFERKIPEGRSEDAHDVLGTFDLINDPLKRRQLPASPEELLGILRTHHAQMLERRPEANPGAFKSRPNHAGATTFVEPELVTGTLIEGFRFFEALAPGLPSAIFLMFLISEVHPFKDGNGRVGRVLMNAALSSAGQQRIVIPLSYCDDYLGGLRAMSRTGNPRPLISVLDFAQRYATGIQWNDQTIAQSILESTNAFVPPDEAEASGRRLRLPPGSTA
jgi:Fic family protein